MGKRMIFRQIGSAVSQFFKNLKRNLFFLFIIAIIILLVPFGIRLLFSNSFKGQVFESVDETREVRVALVFGAGLEAKDDPGKILEDRVLSAVDLYKAGKIKKIIMSGDNRTLDYDEPSAMIDLAVQNGVSIEDLQPDYAGRRTYDSCYRARDIFSLTEVIVVTQKFHLDRAMYICSSLGIETYGFVADRQEYENAFYNYVRDTYAFILAVWDVNLRKPPVVLGEKIEI